MPSPFGHGVASTPATPPATTPPSTTSSVTTPTSYGANNPNHNTTIHNFVRNYANELYTAPPHPYKPIQPHELKESCIAAQKSAEGLDYFSPEDFR